MVDWVDGAIEEYKTLRQESLQSMQQQHSTLSYGIASVGAVFLAGFSLISNKTLFEVIFLGILPALCYLILIIWMGELARMMRAGQYLMRLENEINEAIKGSDTRYGNKPGPLRWENWLRESKLKGGTNQNRWNYIFIILLFLALALASIVIANYYSSTSSWAIIAVESVGFLIISIFLFIRCLKFN